jgi:hypothetical protein
VVDQPDKHEALSSNPNTNKKAERKKERKRKHYQQVKI